MWCSIQLSYEAIIIRKYKHLFSNSAFKKCLKSSNFVFFITTNLVRRFGVAEDLQKKEGQATLIAPLNLIPLLHSCPGGLRGSWS